MILALHSINLRSLPLSGQGAVKAKKLKIPSSSDFIELLPYNGLGTPRHFQNLSRCSPSGESVWLAELPTNSVDSYVDIEIEGHRVIAFSWSCYRVEINIDSGAVEKSTFTK